MTSRSLSPRRGEIWRVNFDPSVGTEIQKVRPAVVVSSDSIGKLPIKMIAPITGWDARFERNLWHVRIDPDNHNGLTKTSAIDVLQLRGADIQRFIERMGYVTANTMEEVAAKIATVIEYE
ncbi:MAG: type II toxin-antitoxin system PemK/MazF family toxin [Capsulimonadaceae bacterium]